MKICLGRINKTKVEKKTEVIKEEYDNAISLNAETTANLFEDLGYDLKGVRAGQKVKPIYLTQLPKKISCPPLIWHDSGIV